MKKIKEGTFKKIISLVNLERAWLEVQSVKKGDSNIINFSYFSLIKLYLMMKDLENGTWKPIPKPPFLKHEKKDRIITPINEEGKIVAQAIYRIIAPELEKKYIFESHACVKNHGQHLSALRVQMKFFSYDKNKDFFNYKGDIHHYFQSVNHNVLKKIIRKYFIKDRKLLALLNTFIDAYEEGIPIGWLTSEILANIYLYPFDRIMKETFPDLFYSRFMDDFVISGTDKRRVKKASKFAIKFLKKELKLDINPKSNMYKNQVNYCGYLIFKQYMKPRAKVVRSTKRRFLKYIKYGEFDKLICSINSFFGYLSIAESKTVIEKMIYKIFKNILSNRIQTDDIHEFFLKFIEIFKIKNQFEKPLGIKKMENCVTSDVKKKRNLKVYQNLEKAV